MKLCASCKANPRPEMEGRQSRLVGKTRYALLLENENYDWLDSLARSKRLSIAAVLNQLIRTLRREKFHVE